MRTLFISDGESIPHDASKWLDAVVMGKPKVEAPVYGSTTVVHAGLCRGKENLPSIPVEPGFRRVSASVMTDYSQEGKEKYGDFSQFEIVDHEVQSPSPV